MDMFKRTALALTLAGVLWSCTGAQREPAQTPDNVMELEIDGLSFIGPNEIASGWTTIRINNDSGMEHFGLVYRLPEGVTGEMIGDQVVKPIQQSLTANIAGDTEKAAQIMATIPAWIADIQYLGGPGMMSTGVIGEATMNIEPGNYIVECYVKTNGIQHNYHPTPGMHGMVLAFTVRDEGGGMAEPEANVTLDITNTGYAISSGQFRAGENSVRVNFVEQQLYNNFVGHDAHVFRIDEDTDVDAAAKWINFFPNDGQQTPAPAHFVGGIHDMPQGSTAYFKLNLEEGEYGVVAEIPDAKGAGLFTRFSVAGG
jgi:hypothetical protein